MTYENKIEKYKELTGESDKSFIVRYHRQYARAKKGEENYVLKKDAEAALDKLIADEEAKPKEPKNEIEEEKPLTMKSFKEGFKQALEEAQEKAKAKAEEKAESKAKEKPETKEEEVKPEVQEKAETKEEPKKEKKT